MAANSSFGISQWICRNQHSLHVVRWCRFCGRRFLADVWRISCTKWKIDIFGTSGSSQETVCLTLKEDNDHIYAVQKTLSGNPVDTIESLCMRIQCTSLQQSEVLFALFTATNWKNGTTVVDWKYGSFLLEENFAIPTKNSCFCYGSVFDDVKHEEVLQALNFQQKIVLWTAFLKNGFDYEEFEWLYNAIAENVVPNRIEWELSLHTAMQNLGYIIQVLPNDFELYDGNGCRRYFSFNSASYAERTFLKILFPLNMWMQYTYPKDNRILVIYAASERVLLFYLLWNYSSHDKIII